MPAQWMRRGALRASSYKIHLHGSSIRSISPLHVEKAHESDLTERRCGREALTKAVW